MSRSQCSEFKILFSHFTECCRGPPMLARGGGTWLFRPSRSSPVWHSRDISSDCTAEASLAFLSPLKHLTFTFKGSMFVLRPRSSQGTDHAILPDCLPATFIFYDLFTAAEFIRLVVYSISPTMKIISRNSAICGISLKLMGQPSNALPDILGHNAEEINRVLCHFEQNTVVSE